MWVFLDRAQSLRREPVEPPIEGAFRLALDLNCRNTRRIVACANAATQNESEPFELAPLGRPPKIIVPQSPAAISGLVQQEVRVLLSEHRLTPRQIALIGPASRAKGPLTNVAAIGGIPIIESASEWREGKGLLCTTARSFKGLEADVIILCDFAGLSPLFTMSDLYVAMTRARSHLIIVARDRLAKAVLGGALAAALAVGSDE
jgi:superfamily I DNA/RNA helicase